MYNYSVSLIRVVDGDTIFVDLDLGFNVSTRLELRLLGINAPEMRGATRTAGLAAKEHLASLLSRGSLTVKTEKPLKTDKYGRWLATVTVTAPDGTSFDANAQMITEGFAVSYMV